MFIVMHHSSQGIYKKNILFKSLNVEIFKTTLGILLIFFFLVVGSRFAGYFDQASEGHLDPNLILKIVILRVPDFISLLVPLSFFLGIVITISRLYADREIYGYLSVGLSNIGLIKYLIFQASTFFIITFFLSIYIAPYTKELSKEIYSIDTIQEQFETIKPKNLITHENEGFLYVNAKEGKIFSDVVLLTKKNNLLTLIHSNQLKYHEGDKDLKLKFDKGYMHIIDYQKNQSISSEFGSLEMPIAKDLGQVSGISFNKLFDFSSNSSQSQMQWNYSIPITIFVLLILGVPISKVEPRQGRLSVALPAIFIYILYLSFLILARESFSPSNPSSMFYIWYVHFFFLVIGIFVLINSSFNKLSNLINFFKRNKYLRIFILTITALIIIWLIR
ncbi:MAG: permease [Gammaproteobacteria bacterium]|nr:permease [Gammaproteobacteria bacterium]|tara:strand:- start:528 stop:1697 length:1170 start_codon:yes stop_codon:yes gene_type:complete